MNQEKGKRSKESDLRAEIERAWEESTNRPEVNKHEQAVADERERKFHDELLQLLEAKNGKYFVDDRRTYMVDEIKYEMPVDKVYVDLEGEDDFARRKQLFGLKNKKSSVTDQERGRVRQLNQELEGDYPKKTPRYGKIAEQLDMKLGRVRYIIEVSGDNK